MNERSLRVRPALLVVALAAGLVACDSSEDAPTIGGTYRGSATVDDVTVDYRIVIPNTSGGSFTWSGSFAYGGAGDEPIGGPGTYDYPTITLTDDGDALTGTVSPDGDRLTFTDPDIDVSLVVTR